MTSLFIKILTSVFLSVISVNALAQDRVRDQFDRDFLNAKTVKTFELSGILRCENAEHSEGESCNLNFIRLTDGKKFEVGSNLNLVRVHCGDHKDVLIKISGQYPFQSVFGPERVIVEKFKTIKKLQAGDVTRLLSSISSQYEYQSVLRGSGKRDI